jgi:predicted dienelactone hydrolase
MGIRISVLAVALLFVKSSFASVGFHRVTVPDPQGKPIAVGIWYPSHAKASPHPLGFFTQTVAVDGKMAGKHLPLIVISHGAYGSLASHYDTALALARAGFVVAALTHTGDNDRDYSYIGNRKDLIDRPRQVKVVLDWMLSFWAGHSHLDARRVGIFGFSLGGFTSLVEIGGTPELSRMALLCSTRPYAPECAFIKNSHGNQLEPNPAKPDWTHDPVIRAAVVAAPAVAFLFGPGDLRDVHVPVQLWRAEKDTNAPGPWNSALVYKELPKHPEEHVVPDADHYAFLAPCSKTLAAAVPEICHDPPGFNRAAFHRYFNRSVINFFEKELPKH